MFMRTTKGFTLLELMIVVALVAILATLAYASYTNYVFRVHRADGREMLMRVAAAQERFFTNQNVYSSSVTAAAPAGLGFSSAASEKGYYNVAIVLTNGGQGYTLQGAPQNSQATDACGQLTITNTGQKGPVGPPYNSNGDCW